MYCLLLILMWIILLSILLWTNLCWLWMAYLEIRFSGTNSSSWRNPLKHCLNMHLASNSFIFIEMISYCWRLLKTKWRLVLKWVKLIFVNFWELLLQAMFYNPFGRSLWEEVLTTIFLSRSYCWHCLLHLLIFWRTLFLCFWNLDLMERCSIIHHLKSSYGIWVLKKKEHNFGTLETLCLVFTTSILKYWWKLWSRKCLLHFQMLGRSIGK